MKYGSLILEKKEYVYLKRILNISGYMEDFQTQRSLQKLSEELKNAMIVDEEDMPKDVIRFNSIIKVSSTENKWEKTIQLVTPTERNVKLDKISILTPMGAALIGYSEDDTVLWDFPTGKKNLHILSVAQDENVQKIEVPI
jgi:regulator of nucleoside diphosphate kinase